VITDCSVTYRQFRRTKPAVGLPQVRFLFDYMNEHKIPIGDLADVAGISRHTLTHWRMGRRTPTVADLEACYNAIGFTLAPQKRD
jgi:transcriptional regulator with XRE-family HTH domain